MITQRSLPRLRTSWGTLAGNFTTGTRGHDHLGAVDAHVRRALQDEDRFLFARVTVHDGRLARLVAGDLRPELIGLEEHLAHALVGGERLELVEIEDLGDSRRRGNRGLVHR
jgi:hypothetical protein